MPTFNTYRIDVYDAAGRVISDPGRGIALVEWSEAGYPMRVITDAGEQILYRYSATGVKLSETYLDSEGSLLRTHEICGRFELTDGKVERVQVQCGYLDAAWKFHRYVPDYQGNIIGVVNTSTGLPEQVTNYYPYGTPHAGGMGETVNRKAFGGKDYTREFGVHTLDFEARPYSPLTGSFLAPDPLASDLPSISPYAYCAGDPVNLTDPTGCEIRGVSKRDAELVMEDVKDMFPGEVFSAFRELITRTGKKQNGKSLAPISQESVSEAFAGVTLNDDQQALMEMVVNTINSKEIHNVEYIESNGNISLSAEKLFAPLFDHPLLPVSLVLKANGGIPVDFVRNYGREGTTIPVEKRGGIDTYSLIFMEQSIHINGRAVTTGHELIGHGRSLSLGRGDAYQHFDAIQTENLILRVMGIHYIRNGEDHGNKISHGAFPECSLLPGFR